MGGKVFLRSLSLVFILLVNLAFTAEGREDDLFSKIRINPIKGDKRVPDFFFERLDW